MITLQHIIPPERVVLLQATNKSDALAELAGVIASAPDVTNEAKLLEAIRQREEIMSTGIGLGIAVPHAKIDSVKDFVVGFGKAADGLDFNSLDGEPVNFIVMIAGPENQQERYLQLLARITLKLKDAVVRRSLGEAQTIEEILGALR